MTDLKSYYIVLRDQNALVQFAATVKHESPGQAVDSAATSLPASVTSFSAEVQELG